MGIVVETRHALRIFGICGLASVLVDIDHPITMLLIRPSHPEFENWRFLHPYIFLVAGVLASCLVTYLGGLYILCVLNRVKGGSVH